MGTVTDVVRVLQIVADNDAVDDNLAALDLHRALSRTGSEVRTLALAPGGDAGLASELPTMAPTQRSLAAHTQFRREQRWADVVILRGEAASAAAGVARIRNAAPTVVHLTSEVDRWSRAPVPSRALRSVASAEAIVVRSSEDAAVADRLGRPSDSLWVIPYGVAPVPIVSEPQRRAARVELGLPPEGLVALLTGDAAAVERLRAHADRLGVACTAARGSDEGVVRFGGVEVSDPTELGIAASDVVVADGGTDLPWEVLRAAAAGLAVVSDGIDGPATAEAPIGWPDLGEAATAPVDELRRRGVAAAALVAERHSSEGVARQWVEVLRRASER